VWLRIQHHLKLTPDQLWELYAGACQRGMMYRDGEADHHQRRSQLRPEPRRARRRDLVAAADRVRAAVLRRRCAEGMGARRGRLDLLKHLLAPYGTFEFDERDEVPEARAIERKELDIGPVSLNTAVLSSHTRCRVHMVDYAYNFLINAQPERWSSAAT
jgi:hypothetical protein